MHATAAAVCGIAARHAVEPAITLYPCQRLSVGQLLYLDGTAGQLTPRRGLDGYVQRESRADRAERRQSADHGTDAVAYMLK